MSRNNEKSALSTSTEPKLDKFDKLDQLPVEKFLEILKLSYEPRAVVVQRCSVSGLVIQTGRKFPVPVDDAVTVHEIQKLIKQPAQLAVNKLWRAEALKTYGVILGKAIKQNRYYYSHAKGGLVAKYPEDQKIYFSFPDDTLVYRPNSTERKTTLKQNGEEVVGNDRVVNIWGGLAPEDAFGHLKALLKNNNNVAGVSEQVVGDDHDKADNNLEKVQSIALGNFTWLETKDEAGLADPGMVARQAFYKSVEDGFRNLRELILIYRVYYQRPASEASDSSDSSAGPNHVDLRSTQVQGEVRNIITDMFKREQKIRNACKIPEIIFLDEEEEGAKYYFDPTAEV
ncbi:hypothetical protein GLAREA_00337 [Glarea lozoyensis ATCC 20868]|uniref:Uncharacterized protein n=2 Tax=Glarea lozoyensis TaxID=101852 RepID=S3CRU2_GLAL2|nr:uncharacterized protein GLAREA_00337 [Glarea lozoyensis ATCC 20868]EHL03383.1 hypothetical protein M7I_0605 [Glarea lozoyensis 74030]EPE29177.1 hypothetical protein GLAREA_00337 [Glarea lozoyensis ATCC 20868]